LRKQNGKTNKGKSGGGGAINQIFGKAQANHARREAPKTRGRRSNSGGQRGVPVAYSMDRKRTYLRFVSTPKGDCRVQGRDFLTVLKTPELNSDWDIGAIGQLMYSLPLAPQSIPNSRSRLLASMYQKYQINSVTIHYVSGSPTSDLGTGTGATGSGSILGAFITDPADVNIGNGESALQVLRSTSTGDSTNVWKSTTWHYRKHDNTVYYIDPSTPSSDTPEVRQEQQALFLLYNELAIPSLGASLGSLWISYDYTLINPILKENEILGSEMMLVYDQANLPVSVDATTLVQPDYIVETNGSAISPVYVNVVQSNTITGFDLTSMGLQKDDYVAFVVRVHVNLAFTFAANSAIYYDNLDTLPVGTGNILINDWPFTGSGGVNSFTISQTDKYLVFNGMFKCTSSYGAHIAFRPDSALIAAWNGVAGCTLSIFMRFYKTTNPWNFVSSQSMFARKKRITTNDMVGLDQRLMSFEKRLDEFLKMARNENKKESEDSDVNNNNNNNDIDEYLEKMRDAGRGLRTDSTVVPSPKYTSSSLDVPITSIPEKRSGSPSRKF
jgi:hypothetical protein